MSVLLQGFLLQKVATETPFLLLGHIIIFLGAIYLLLGQVRLLERVQSSLSRIHDMFLHITFYPASPNSGSKLLPLL